MPNPNPYRKTSKLNIRTRNQDGKTVIDDVYFTAPYKITRPFYEGYGKLKIMVLAVSAGILEGDVQEITIDALEGTNTIITSQSYEKIFKMKDNDAKRNTRIYVSRDSFLKYVPLPTIPFADSAFTSRTDVELEDSSSKFIMSEIITCGRYARGEKFQYKYFKSLVSLTSKGRLLYRDNTVYKPKDFAMDSIGMFEDYTHLANILIFNFNIDDNILDQIRKIIDKSKAEGGVSYTWSKDVVVRILGNNAQFLEGISEKIIKSIEENEEE